MINSKLVGKTLPEIIHMIVFEQITEFNYHDGEYMEMLLEGYISQDDIDDLSDKLSELEVDVERLEDALQEEQEHVEYLEKLLKENEIEF